MASLDRIEIEGYRSIKRLKLRLKAINILIGANGAGKSNLVGAFGLLGDLVDGKLQLHVGRRGGANALLHFGVKKTKKLRIKVSFGANAYEAVLEPSAKDRLIFANEKAYFQGEGERWRLYVEDLGEGQKESGLEEEATTRPDRVADHVLIFENAYYSVISPEACSAILWRDRRHAAEAAEALKLTAQNLLKLEVVDEIIAEPPGGAHRDYDSAAANLGEALRRSLERISQIPVAELLEKRYQKFRRLGVFSEGKTVTVPARV
jgi:predicted ATPase